MLRFVLVLLVGGLASCIGSEAEPSSSPERLQPAAPPVDVPVQADRSFVPGERFGGVTSDMTILQIERLYGASNVVTTQVDLGEGMTAPGYRLFPGQRDEALLLLGEDKRPANIIVRRPDARWYAAKPALLMMQLRLADLIESNGGPFTFTGFDWDYGGTVTDWQGGRLSGTQVRLSYAPERLPAGGLPAALMGDRPIESSDTLAQGIGLYVSEFTIGLSQIR